MSCARPGDWCRLEPRVFNVLAYLVQHPGRTVTKEELEAQLWPDSELVGRTSLANAVAQARKALATRARRSDTSRPSIAGAIASWRP